MGIESPARAARWLGVALIAAFNFSRASLGQIQYSLTDLGTLSGSSNVVAYSINNKGQVVGWFDNPSVSNRNAFIWQNGVLSNLGTLGGTYAEARAINDAGHVAGFSTVPNNVTNRAFLYTNGVMFQLAGTPSGHSFARGLNNLDFVAGQVDRLGPHAVLWTNNAPKDLGTVSGIDSSQGFDVNDYTQVVGFSHAPTFATQYRPFVWQNGAMSALPTLSNGLHGVANAINNLGQVVGGVDAAKAIQAGDPVYRHAFLWEQGVLKDLGILGGLYCEALDINESGVVEGFSDLTGGLKRAFIWRDGVQTNLNGLIDTNSGWILNSAQSINNSGQIVGWGSVSGVIHSFLLNPLAVTVAMTRVVVDDLNGNRPTVIWRGSGTNMVYTLESSSAPTAQDWSAVAPTSRWPSYFSYYKEIPTSAVFRTFRVLARPSGP